jgi:4-diphosphocytidyl-2-C-methyl-D-erythritol kinase
MDAQARSRYNSGMEVIIDAPAKINLHLQVGALREDRYHELLSVFHLIDIADTLRVRKSGPPGSVLIHGPFDFPAEINLLHIAAMRYFEMFYEAKGVHPEEGVEVFCTKRIPDGGGLGGGSSDAAALLKAMKILFGIPESSDRLFECALAVGSDVPFFLSTAAALVRGRGEILSPLPPLPEYGILLVFPGWKVSTPAAYCEIDRRREQIRVSAEALTAEQLSEDYEELMLSGRFFNDFTPVVSLQYPEIDEIIEQLRDSGALYAQMSGSGSTIFGLYRHDHNIIRTSGRFLERGFGVHTGKMLACPIEPVYNGRNI